MPGDAPFPGGLVPPETGLDAAVGIAFRAGPPAGSPRRSLGFGTIRVSTARHAPGHRVVRQATAWEISRKPQNQRDRLHRARKSAKMTARQATAPLFHGRNG